MAEENLTRIPARQFAGGESESAESESSGFSMAPPAFRLDASSLNPTPPAESALSGEAPIQRQVIQRQLRTAESSSGSLAILHSLLHSGNTAAMRVVERAISQRLARATESGGEIHVICVGGGDQFDLILAAEDARIMMAEFQARVQTIERAATTAAFDTTRSAPVAGTFAFGFNHHFAEILPALRQADPVVNGGLDPRNAFFTQEELDVMFTPSQQASMASYFREPHIIPDHLFDNGNVGNANTRQRIVLSSHILTHGRVRRGEFTQQVHARMCGHWVELVYNYAGAAITEARGMEFSFDHEGETTMGAGRTEGIFEGARRELTPEEHDPERPLRSFRRGAFSIDRFPTLQPGDWVYVFTNTNTAGGDHSGIFSHWVDSEPQRDGSAPYQRALVHSQRDPDYAGTADEWLLSDRDGTARGRQFHTVSRIVRHSDDAEATATVADVETSDLGVRVGRSSNTIASTNENFLRTKIHRGIPINPVALVQAIQQINAQLLDRLEATGRTTENQLFLWRGTNQSQDLEVLVRLNERINNLIMGATTLERTMDAANDLINPRREAAQADAEIRRVALDADLARITADIAGVDAALQIDDKAVPLRQRRTLLLRDIEQLQRAKRQARTREERNALQGQIQGKIAERAQLLTQIQEIEAWRDQAVADARAAEGNWRVGGRSTREHRNRLIARRQAIQDQIHGLDEAGGYELSHPGVRGDFRGDGTGRALLTGLLRNLRPAPNWDSLRTP